MKMKTPKTLLVITSALAITCAVFTGCAAAKRVMGSAYVPTAAAPVTNSVPILGLAPDATGALQPYVAGYTNLVSTGTNYTPKPGITGTIEAGKAVAPFLPPPFDIIITGALTAIGAGLGLWGKKLSNQTTTQNAVIGSVITGVEAATTIGQAITAQSVKTAIQKAAIDNGVAGELHAQVKQLTENAPPQS